MRENVTLACRRAPSSSAERNIAACARWRISFRSGRQARLLRPAPERREPAEGVLAKWLHTDAQVLILDEPTRGIDVGAKREIYRLMREIADRGAAVLMISSELPEVIGVCDRILVMHEGSLVGELPVGATEEQIMTLATGGAL